MLKHGFEDWPAGPLHVAVGVFDGVHLGHQEVVRRLREGARSEGATALAATFEPLPLEVFAPGAPPSALSTLNERAELLRQSGAEVVVAFHFDHAFSLVPASQFAERLLHAGDVRRLVVGPDFRFGHGRQGDVALLREIALLKRARVDVAVPVEREGQAVSSTRIRNLLLAGDVGGAAALLGRQYLVPGRLLHGPARGRTLGYPTVDLRPPSRRLLPRDGIYATWVGVAQRRWPAATNVAVRPVGAAGERTIESYFIDPRDEPDFDHADEATTTFVARLRDDRRFASSEELTAQIADDVAAARLVLGVRAHGG